jgi:hypothetical protein
MYEEEFKKLTLRELILCLSSEKQQKVLEFVQECHQDVSYGGGSTLEIDSQYKIIEMAINKYMKE